MLAASGDPTHESETTAEPADEQKLAELRERFVKELEPGLGSQGFVAFDLLDKHQRIVAAYTNGLLGQTMPQIESVLARTFEGEPSVSAPFPSTSLLKDKAGKLRSGTPTMFVCAPLRDDNFQVVGVLALRIRAGERIHRYPAAWDASARRAKPMPSTRTG